MRLPILGLIVLSFILSWLLTFVMKRIAPRLGFVDKPGGRKIHANPRPLGGGVAIFWAFALPLIAVLIAARMAHPQDPLLIAYVGGVREKTWLALAILGTLLILHIMGLADDRKALGPYLKLAVQLLAAGLLVLAFPEM